MARAQMSVGLPETGAEMTAQTFEFGKRLFVSGLFWQPLPGSTAKLRNAEIQKMSEEQGFDLAVLRTTGVPQVGFAALTDGVRPGMLSAAAMVSKSLEMANRDRSFLCAIPIPNGKWLYVAQREGVLLHDGDMIGTEEAAQARMMSDLSLIEWQTVFAPAHWGVPNATQRTFEDLLPKSGSKYSFKKWWEVRPIRSSWLDHFQISAPVMGILIVLGIGLLGYYAWDHYSKQQALEELARQEVAEQAARAAAVAEQPWKKQTRAAGFIAACDQALASVPTLWPAGWAPDNAVCKDRNLVITWARQETGRLEHLLNTLPDADIAIDGNKATLTRRLELPGGENDVLPKQKERIAALYDIAQRYGFNFALKAPANEAPVLGQPAEAEPTWKSLEWTVADMALAPVRVAPLFEGGGFRLNQIKLSFAEGIMKWTMEGTQYVQP
ncbi:MAG: type 4b pilus protein PilO2 [Sterolibacterium sp.]|jgi:hypothetical protein|nr:type 4b pilus protein PilO2 [Sterolibacterium sp.]